MLANDLLQMWAIAKSDEDEETIEGNDADIEGEGGTEAGEGGEQGVGEEKGATEIETPGGESEKKEETEEKKEVEAKKDTLTNDTGGSKAPTEVVIAEDVNPTKEGPQAPEDEGKNSKESKNFDGVEAKSTDVKIEQANEKEKSMKTSEGEEEKHEGETKIPTSTKGDDKPISTESAIESVDVMKSPVLEEKTSSLGPSAMKTDDIVENTTGDALKKHLDLPEKKVRHGKYVRNVLQYGLSDDAILN
jgi:hypothetical protein